MGFLLKIVLFGVALYGLWKTFQRWKGLFDRFVGRPDTTERPAPPPPAAPPAPPSGSQTSLEARRSGPVLDVVPCPRCGAYAAAGVAKCEECGQSLPEGRSPG